MTSSPRRIAAIALAVVLIIGVGFAIISSVGSSLGPAPVTLTGLIGSEKAPFFADDRVNAALKRGGFIVKVSTAGSRQIAEADLSKDDFAFPAGRPGRREDPDRPSGLAGVRAVLHADGDRHLEADRRPPRRRPASSTRRPA